MRGGIVLKKGTLVSSMMGQPRHSILQVEEAANCKDSAAPAKCQLTQRQYPSDKLATTRIAKPTMAV